MKSRRPGRSVASKSAQRSAGSSSTGTMGTKSLMAPTVLTASRASTPPLGDQPSTPPLGDQHRVSLVVALARGRWGMALDVDLRQDSLEPAGEPPVLVTQELHRGGHEQQPHDGGV